MTARAWLLLAALNGLLAVAAGALAAHAAALSPDSAAGLATGARYQMYHALALVGVALLAGRGPGRARALSTAGLLFAIGIVLFSGGLYSRALLGPGPVGAVVPLGGVALLLGWAALGWHALAELR